MRLSLIVGDILRKAANLVVVRHAAKVIDNCLATVFFVEAIIVTKHSIAENVEDDY